MAGPEARLGLETDMNGCADIQASLCEWLDGELPQEQHAAVDAHLNQCVACSAAVAELRSAVQAVSSLAPKKAPVSILAGVRAQLRAEPAASVAAETATEPDPSTVIRAGEAFERKPRLQPWTRGLISVAAFLAVGVLVFNAVAPYTPPSETMVAPESGTLRQAAEDRMAETDAAQASPADVPSTTGNPMPEEEVATQGEGKNQQPTAKRKDGNAENRVIGVLQQDEKLAGKLDKSAQQQAQASPPGKPAPRGGREEHRKLADGELKDTVKALEGMADPEGPDSRSRIAAEKKATVSAPAASTPNAPPPAASRETLKAAAKAEMEAEQPYERKEAAGHGGGVGAAGEAPRDALRKEWTTLKEQEKAKSDEQTGRTAQHLDRSDNAARLKEEVAEQQQNRIKKDQPQRDDLKADEYAKAKQPEQAQANPLAAELKSETAVAEGAAKAAAPKQTNAEAGKRGAAPAAPAAQAMEVEGETERKNRTADRLARLRLSAEKVPGFAEALKQLAAKHGGRIEGLAAAENLARRRAMPAEKTEMEANQKPAAAAGNGTPVKVMLPVDKAAAFRTALAELQRGWSEYTKAGALGMPEDRDHGKALASGAAPETPAKEPAANTPPSLGAQAEPDNGAMSGAGAKLETVEFVIELVP